jgi:hypothetical protein
MTWQDEGRPERRGATVAQLKDDIDRGRTGDKVGGLDPGAAPLGTDEEAGGERITPELCAYERTLERRLAPRPSTRANGATPELAPDGRLPPQRGLPLMAAMGVAAGVALALVMLLAL